MSEWSIDNIRIKRDELELRNKQLKKEAKMLEAEKQFLQSICEHPNKREWNYGPGSDQFTKCDDCGFHETH